MNKRVKKVEYADNTKQYIVFCKDNDHTVIYANNLTGPTVQRYARKGAYAIENPNWVGRKAIC